MRRAWKGCTCSLPPGKQTDSRPVRLGSVLAPGTHLGLPRLRCSLMRRMPSVNLWSLNERDQRTASHHLRSVLNEGAASLHSTRPNFALSLSGIVSIKPSHLVIVGPSRPDLIDSALLRPGRLDKSLLCDIPSPCDRREVRPSFFSVLEESTRRDEASFPLGFGSLIRFGASLTVKVK